ncbi:MAG: hypothetical protein KC561_13775 [Myxococcales bacterium]|nr:hypothetical protein [Myxococcales bacterium]
MTHQPIATPEPTPSAGGLVATPGHPPTPQSPPTGRPELVEDPDFGIPLPPDARLQSDLGNLIIFRTSYTWPDTCEAYHRHFRGGDARASRHDADHVCSVMRDRDVAGYGMISIQLEDDGGTSVKLFR